LVADISHISGLVAAQELNNPFAYCDVVITTTHVSPLSLSTCAYLPDSDKTLRGPRAAIIFVRKDLGGAIGLERRVNDAVFPGYQGAPHNHVRLAVAHVHVIMVPFSQTIAAIATALLQVSHPSFCAYAKQVIANARVLAQSLTDHGYKLQTGGTDNHIILWDLRPLGLTGNKMEKLCELIGIIVTSELIPRSIPHFSNASRASSFRKRRFR
jgi:glycine hydroxymethyltransferase